MTKIHVFVSFDLNHDEDLCNLLLEQSERPSLGIEVLGCSKARSVNDAPGEGVRRQIRQADEVIVICGEHTGDSFRVDAELRIAQEEQKPYFLLWGRRERMCSKPSAAKRDEGMYCWTPEILQSQIVQALRTARWDRTARGGPAISTA
jgi:hypothetical protein